MTGADERRQLTLRAMVLGVALSIVLAGGLWAVISMRGSLLSGVRQGLAAIGALLYRTAIRQ